jgi:hypothetical protein
MDSHWALLITSGVLSRLSAEIIVTPACDRRAGTSQ